MSVTLTHADVKDEQGQSPLDLALEEMYDNDCIDVALYLINRGCGDDENKNKLLRRSCLCSRLDVVKELVEEHNCDPKGECCVYTHVHMPGMYVIFMWCMVNKDCTVLLYRKFFPLNASYS